KRHCRTSPGPRSRRSLSVMKPPDPSRPADSVLDEATSNDAARPTVPPRPPVAHAPGSPPPGAIPPANVLIEKTINDPTAPLSSTPAGSWGLSPGSLPGIAGGHSSDFTRLFLLGEGGMGRVHLAQHHQYPKRW